MNDKLEYQARPSSFPSGNRRGFSRNSLSYAGASNAPDFVCGHDGTSSILAEGWQRGRVVPVKSWIKDRPLLLPYLSFVAMLEIIVVMVRV